MGVDDDRDERARGAQDMDVSDADASPYVARALDPVVGSMVVLRHALLGESPPE